MRVVMRYARRYAHKGGHTPCACITILNFAILKEEFRSYPSSSFFLHQGLHRLDPSRMVVQTAALVQLFAACVPKQLARLVADLIDRFQAVGGEAGCGNEYPLDALLGEPFQGLVGIGLEP